MRSAKSTTDGRFAIDSSLRFLTPAAERHAYLAPFLAVFLSGCVSSDGQPMVAQEPPAAAVARGPGAQQHARPTEGPGPIQSNVAHGTSGQSRPASEGVEESSGEKNVAKRGQTIDEKFLFYPVAYPEGDWAPENLNFSDIWFEADDGARLHGWYCPTTGPRAVILYTHGNGGNLSHRAEVLRRLQQQLRASVLIFDYRGYGRCGGTPTVDGILRDARAARKQLAELAKVNSSEIVLMGRSLGGAVAVQLAAESPARGLVLESTFASLRDVAREHFKMLAWLVPGKKLDSETSIKKHKGPLLQSHGDADRTVSFATGQRLFRAANQPREFYAIRGADHNDAQPPEYYRKLDSFLESLPK